MIIRFIKACYFSSLCRFLFVGGVSFLANAAVFLLLRREMPLTLAFVIAFVFAVTVSWILNRVFTFQSKDERRAQEWFRFFLVYSFTGIIQTSLFSCLVNESVFMHTYSLAASMIAAITVMGLNYFLSKRFTFLRLNDDSLASESTV